MQGRQTLSKPGALRLALIAIAISYVIYKLIMFPSFFEHLVREITR